MMGKRCLSGNVYTYIYMMMMVKYRKEMNMERVESYTQNRVMEHKYFHFKCKRYDDLHALYCYNGNLKQRQHKY